jgi:hypothetical protein
MVNLSSSVPKTYTYRMVKYKNCPLCFDDTYHICIIKSSLFKVNKEPDYYSLACNRCQSHFLYEDIAHITSNYPIIKQHNRQKSDRVFRNFFIAIIIGIIVFSIFYELSEKNGLSNMP